MPAKILNKMEASAQAQALSHIPDDIINSVNKEIVESMARDKRVAQFSQPNGMSDPQWRALMMLLRNDYTITEASCQRDGRWVDIKLD